MLSIYGEKKLTDRLITIKPQHMTATSIIITPDKAEAVVTFYSHEFTHVLQENMQPKSDIQVRVDLKPEVGISLTPNQAVALAKSLRGALEASGLWKE